MSLRTEDIRKEDPEEVFQLMDVVGEGFVKNSNTTLIIVLMDLFVLVKTQKRVKSMLLNF